MRKRQMREYTISEGKCIFNSCGEGKYLKNGTCAINTVEACGSETNDCTRLAGWKTGSCSNGACIAETCNINYHIIMNDVGGICVANTHTECGGTPIDCSKNYETGEFVCYEGRCVSICTVGQIYCHPNCIDVRYNDLHCGGCGINCLSMNKTCIEGECR